jgi:hypothetical protein
VHFGSRDGRPPVRRVRAFPFPARPFSLKHASLGRVLIRKSSMCGSSGIDNRPKGQGCSIRAPRGEYSRRASDLAVHEAANGLIQAHHDPVACPVDHGPRLAVQVLRPGRPLSVALRIDCQFLCAAHDQPLWTPARNRGGVINGASLQPGTRRTGLRLVP